METIGYLFTFHLIELCLPITLLKMRFTRKLSSKLYLDLGRDKSYSIIFSLKEFQDINDVRNKVD